jgi:hypothetical protein
MDGLSIIVTLVAVYFAKKEYDDGRIGMAMFWAALIGWDLHVLAYYGLK